ncbi:hypothetical protein [Arthrobacter sp. H16F315]|uniref:hypothetical protein n=1 Tax=Arthrobacter sp. H16F315 TaxID=2955314 RepID=UPI002098541C|nr:hypothetical protein [Arthrobacter sp. H16F315]MDD1477519.1 hypothetical protein [Arthrobacter sp. H16F315]
MGKKEPSRKGIGHQASRDWADNSRQAYPPGRAATDAARRAHPLRLRGNPQAGITDSASPSQALAPQASSPTTSAPLETSQASNKAPVYWIGRSNNSTFLYREFRDVTEQDNPVTRALRVMTSQKPLDPDFFTPWQDPKKTRKLHLG